MANEFFSFQDFDFSGAPDKLSSINRSCESMEEGNIGKQMNFCGTESWGDSGGVDSLYSSYGFYQDDSSFLFSRYQQYEEQRQSLLDHDLLDNLRFDIPSPPIQARLEEIAKLSEIPNGTQDFGEPKKERPHPSSLASLELLKNYGNGFKRLNGERIIEPRNDPPWLKVESPALSTEEIMRLAGERFVQTSSQTVDVASILSNPFDFPFSGLTDEEAKNVELAEFLLASAEKVGYQQFERASRLLNQCDYLSSNTGNPVQRIVYYFSEALRERIDRETGRVTAKGLGKKQTFDIDEAMMSPTPAILACHKLIPFTQVMQLTGIQAIIENVAEAKRIHIIDLAVKNGVQWTVLIQSLALRLACPPELLKITAVGTRQKHLIEETGKRLTSFAETMNVPFSFKIVMVPDMLDLKEDLLELDAEETVAVYADVLLRTMIVQPDRLDATMRTIRNINPSIMVVCEVEANHNSPIFVSRFIEALFHISVFFDCIDNCMDRDDPNRMIIESMFFGHGVRNIVAAEGEERKIRHVKLDVWRAFFARFGMEETELSTASFYQASLVVKKFGCGGSCTIDMDGKSLMIGWKGTPVHSLSVWKFL